MVIVASFLSQPVFGVPNWLVLVVAVLAIAVFRRRRSN